MHKGPNHFLHLSRDQVTELLKQVSAAKSLHIAWLDDLSRTIACRLPPAPIDREENAHHCCGFGRWFHSEAPAFLTQEPLFAELGRIHAAMHAEARNVLRELETTGQIGTSQYDRYKSRQRQLIDALDAIAREVRVIDCQLDPLTGVCSRRGMMPRLREEQARSLREKKPCALLLLDLDHFKNLNDTWGHPTGDAALRNTAQTCLKALRPYDRMYRYGGEEFLVCLPGTNLAQAFWLAERLRERLIETPVLELPPRLYVTASFGVTVLETDRPIEECILQADRALYEAKAGGRNRVCVYGAETHPMAFPASPGKI